MKNKNIIEIQEEVKIGNVILEKGDKIKVLNNFIKESAPNEATTYEELKDMNLTALKGYARRIGLSNLSGLTDKETALDEIMGFLYGEDWQITLMKQGVI